jgi:hypothetical protein
MLMKALWIVWIGTCVVIILAEILLIANLVVPKVVEQAFAFLIGIPLEDYFLSFVPELLGIILTVLVINRIIKAREERSWRPAKRVLHDRVLTEILEPFLAASKKIQRDIKDKETSDRFISADGDPSVNLRDEIRKEIVVSQRHEIEALFTSSGQLIGPELSNMLHSFDEQLDDVGTATKDLKERWRKQPPRSQEEVTAGLKPLSECIEEAVRKAEQTKSWLKRDLSRDPPMHRDR